MKVEEIQIALKKNQDIRISLTLIDDINNAFEKGLEKSDVSKLLISAQTNIKSGIALYDIALKFAEKGMTSAKELGATDTISFLSKKSDQISVATKSDQISVATKSAHAALNNINSALSNI